MVSSPISKRSKTLTNTSGDNAASVQSDLSQPDFSIPFIHYLEIPKSTPLTAPLVYTLNLPIGKINKLWIEFPRGCSGLAGFQMHRATRQIFPLPEDVWLRSDNIVMAFAFSHAIKTEPYEVILKGYNLDDTYPHTIWIVLEMSGFSKELTPAMQAFMKTLQGS